MTYFHLALIAGTLAASTIGTHFYGKLAVRFGIVAVPNERSLHKYKVPRGGGIAIAVPFLLLMVALYATGELPLRWFLALVGGGTPLAVVGLVDDVVELSAKVRLGLHVALAVWVLGCLNVVPVVNLGFAVVNLGPLGLALFGLGVVWMINLHNFMDGIDGMAASGSVFTCTGASILLISTGGTQLFVPVAILGAASLGFLFFNWPPARLFMGDTGSAFLGYISGVFLLISHATGTLSLWTWVILMGYFVADTTTTTVLRISTVKRWWGTHRSHAYQNLARVWNDHRRMTLVSLAFECLWLFPFAAASVRWPREAALFAVVALAPIVGFTLKYGPLYAK